MDSSKKIVSTIYEGAPSRNPCSTPSPKELNPKSEKGTAVVGRPRREVKLTVRAKGIGGLPLASGKREHAISEMRHRTMTGIFPLQPTRATTAPPYMTTHPQQPFFPSSSSMPILAMPLDGPPDGAPVYDDISLLYLRISRTMS